MSVVITIAPIIIGGWAAFDALATVVAARLGYKLLKGVEHRVEVTRCKEIELVDDKSRVIKESLKPEEKLVFTKSGITITCKRDTRGKFSIWVRGENKTDEELRTIGQTFLNQIKQQYAYQKVVEEITKHGFSIVQEETEGQRIKLVLRKF